MVIALSLALLGFALLALSQERHYRRVFEKNSAQSRAPRAQRSMGFIAVGLALPVCIAGEGASFGSLLWVVLISAAAMAVAAALTWRPGVLRVLRPLLQKLG